MRDAVETLEDFEGNPTNTNVFGEVVFISKVLGNVHKFGSDVLWAVEISFKVKIGDVKAGKLGVWARQETVEYQIDGFQLGSVGTNISRVADMVATDRNSGAVGFGFLWVEITDDLGIGDVPPKIHWDFFVVDNMEGVSAFDMMTSAVGAVPTP